MSARLLACLVLTLIGAVRSSPALLGTSSALGNELSTPESSTSDQESHQGKATLSYAVRCH